MENAFHTRIVDFEIHSSEAYSSCDVDMKLLGKQLVVLSRLEMDERLTEDEKGALAGVKLLVEKFFDAVLEGKNKLDAVYQHPEKFDIV